MRYDLETHPRAMKISELTIFGALISNLNLLNRYNLWFMTYILCQNDGFSLIYFFEVFSRGFSRGFFEGFFRGVFSRGFFEVFSRGFFEVFE